MPPQPTARRPHVRRLLPALALLAGAHGAIAADPAFVAISNPQGQALGIVAEPLAAALRPLHTREQRLDGGGC